MSAQLESISAELRELYEECRQAGLSYGSNAPGKPREFLLAEAKGIKSALDLVEVSDFMLSFPEVRAVSDLCARVKEVEEAQDSRLVGCLCNCHTPEMPNQELHETCVECMRALIEEAEDLGKREAEFFSESRLSEMRGALEKIRDHAGTHTVAREDPARGYYGWGFVFDLACAALPSPPADHEEKKGE